MTTRIEYLEVLEQLEELLLLESLDTTDPEVLAMLDEVTAGVREIRGRLKAVTSN